MANQVKVAVTAAPARSDATRHDRPAGNALELSENARGTAMSCR